MAPLQLQIDFFRIFLIFLVMAHSFLGSVSLLTTNFHLRNTWMSGGPSGLAGNIGQLAGGSPKLFSRDRRTSAREFVVFRPRADGMSIKLV
jgi:hypothetical protein